jgi:hypothetical protein
MKSDRPLIVSILFLATGLTLIFGYCTGTAGFNAAYPVAGASVQLAITTYGPAAIGGVVLTAIGLVLLIWALICAIVGQIQLIGPAVKEREVVRVAPEREKEWAAKS